MRVLGGVMNSRLLVAVVCLLSLAGAQGPWGGESQRPRAQVYALEGLGALGGCAGCGVAAGGLFWLVGGFGPDINLPALGIMGVSLALLPAAVGISAAKAGEALGEDGSTGWAIGGAYGGAVVVVGLYRLGLYHLALASIYSQMDTPSPWLGVAVVSAGVVGLLAIPVGAVIGYNLGPTSYGVGGRLELPEVALTSTRLPDHSVEYGVKVQLAGLKF